MKSKASYFSVSKPLILENLRRFWAIPVLSFLVYFLSGAFPILMSYNRINSIASYIDLSLNNQQPFYMFAHLIFPIMAAVIVFKYLQITSSVSVMHSMPFTRMRLFNSGLVSGLILILAPILLNGIILLAISKPAYSQYGTEMGMVTNTVNLFSRPEILNWIWVSVVMVLFIYAISIFAGIITGNSLMHFAMAIFFNFIVPGLYAIFVAYFSKFLYGFDSAGNWIDFALSISPYLNVLQKAGEFSVGVTIYYVITFLVLVAFSAFLYKRRMLERATDSLVFGLMEPIICYLIAFLGMTLLGFYFDVLGESEFYMYAGLAAGTIIFFMIGQMIVKKTPRIFNKRGFRSFVIYALIAIVFIVGLNLDLTGFEKRLPKVSKVESFNLSENFRYSSFYNNHPYLNTIEGMQFETPDNINAVVALHQSIIENKDRFENMRNVYSSSVSMVYNPGNSFPMNRRYNIDYKFYRNSPEFKTLYESQEYKDLYSFKNLQYERLKTIYINNGLPFSDGVEIKSTKEMEELLACFELDYQSQSFEDMVSLKHGYANVDLSFTYKNKDSDTPERILDGNISLTITKNYSNTIEWLESHGYSEKLEHTADQVEYIEIFHYQRSSDVVEGSFMGERSTVQTMYEGKSLKITEPEAIQGILDRYETINIDYNDYYYGRIVYKGMSSEVSDMDWQKRQIYEEKGIYDSSMQIYFNEGNIPGFILEYFK